MKRSRIFLGATSALLAIAGVAAAKMSHFSSSVTRYYCTHIQAQSSRICVPYTYANCATTEGGTITCYFTVGTSTSKNYTLYTDGPDVAGVKCATSACTTKVLYSVFQ